MSIPEGQRLIAIELDDQQKKDLLRFHETTEDDQGYDVPKDRMKKLARIGLIRSLGFSRYEFTDVGDSMVEALSKPQSAAHLTIPGALEWDGDNGTHGADGESRAHGESDESTAAVATLKALGYTHNGGTHWKPPVGQKPDFDLIDSLRELSVTRILMAVTPGRDGMGHEHYAQSVGEVEQKLGELVGQVEELSARLACTEQSRRSFFDLSQDLEKRLAEIEAERDDYKSKWLANCEAMKLLGIHARHAEKLVKSCREKLEVNSVGKGFIEALDGFIGALGRDDSTHSESVEAKPTCESCGDWGHIETEDSAHDCPECGPSVVERAVEAGVMNAPKAYVADDIPDFTPGSGNKAKRRIAAIEAAKAESFSCWSCSKPVTMEERAVADGDCPHCAAELDLEDWPKANGGKSKTCIECDQPYCHGVCVERGDQDYDRDQAAKGGDQ